MRKAQMVLSRFFTSDKLLASLSVVMLMAVLYMAGLYHGQAVGRKAQAIESLEYCLAALGGGPR